MRVTMEAKEEKLLWAAISGLDVTVGGLAAFALVLLAAFDPQNSAVPHNAFSVSLTIVKARATRS